MILCKVDVLRGVAPLVRYLLNITQCYHPSTPILPLWLSVSPILLPPKGEGRGTRRKRETRQKASQPHSELPFVMRFNPPEHRTIMQMIPIVQTFFVKFWVHNINFIFKMQKNTKLQEHKI